MIEVSHWDRGLFKESSKGSSNLTLLFSETRDYPLRREIDAHMVI